MRQQIRNSMSKFWRPQCTKYWAVLVQQVVEAPHFKGRGILAYTRKEELWISMDFGRQSGPTVHSSKLPDLHRTHLEFRDLGQWIESIRVGEHICGAFSKMYRQKNHAGFHRGGYPCRGLYLAPPG